MPRRGRLIGDFARKAGLLCIPANLAGGRVGPLARCQKGRNFLVALAVDFEVAQESIRKAKVLK
jgi:hypothetical protein